LLAISQISYAQWNNSNPIGTYVTTTGKVGIGTVPLANLDIVSTGPVLRLSTASTGPGLIAFMDASSNTGISNQLNGYMLFGTNNAERMRILANGNIGIGTTTPIGKLTVDDGGTGNVLSEMLTLKTTYGGTSARKAFTWRDGANITGQIDTYYDGVRTNMSFGHLFNNGYQTSDIMTILGNGYVGIGTASPTASLEVVGNIVAGKTSGTHAFQQVLTNRYNGVPGESYGGQFAWYTSSNNSLYKDHALYQLRSWDEGTNTENTLLSVTGGGMVGIGTTTPKEALSVNGNIRSKQVKVQTADWPDYVFKSSYRLPSLLEVKAYIDKYQRLPEMPSEGEVTKNGINLGEIVKLQTKKIEELTLYAIDQQKQIEQLKKDQDARIAVLEKALLKLTAAR
jgi:hypothetical protein